MKIKQASMAMLGIMAIAGMFAKAHAVDATWSGAGADDNWSTPENWVGNVVPAAGSVILFGAADSYSVNRDLTSANRPHQIIFDQNAGAYVFTGNRLELTNSGNAVINQSGITQAFDSGLEFRHWNGVIDTANGDVVVNNGIVHTTTRTPTKEGIGTLTIFGTDTVQTTAPLRISAGTLILDEYAQNYGGENRIVLLQENTLAIEFIGADSGVTTVNKTDLRLEPEAKASQIRLNANGGAGVELNFTAESNAVNRLLSGTLNVDISSHADNSVSFASVATNTATAMSGGIFRWATVTDTDQTGFATLDGTSFVRNTDTEELTPESTGSGDANFHVSGNVDVPGFLQTNSLTITGTGSLSGGTLWGDVLMQEGVGDFTISKPMSRMGYLHQYSTDGMLIFADGGQILDDDDTRSFNKTGPGTVLLSDTAATSSYTGQTSIQQGEFILDGSLSRTSGVDVYAGAVLSGSGSIGATDASSLTVLAGGTLSAAATGALDVNGTLTLAEYAHFSFALDQLEGEALVANGAITLNDNDLQLLLETVPVLYQDELLMQGDSITGIFATINGDAFGPGNTFSLEYDSVLYDFQLLQTADSIYVTAIPEPAHAVVILLLLCAGFVLIRRRRQRA